MTTEALELVDREILRTEVISKMIEEAQWAIKYHSDKVEYHTAQLEFLKSK